MNKTYDVTLNRICRYRGRELRRTVGPKTVTAINAHCAVRIAAEKHWPGLAFAAGGYGPPSIGLRRSTASVTPAGTTHGIVVGHITAVLKEAV